MTTSRTGWWRLPALPPALLLGLIAFHGYQVVALDDDPQRGGAFAMFATIDIGATRTVFVTAADGTVLLELPTSLQGRRAALLDRPTAQAATELAEILLELAWTVEDGRGTVSDDGGVTFDLVRLQVVGFVADGRTVTRRVLTDVAAEAEP